MASFETLLDSWNCFKTIYQRYQQLSFTEYSPNIIYKYIESIKKDDDTIEMPIVCEGIFNINKFSNQIFDRCVFYPFIVRSQTNIQSFTTSAKLKTFFKNSILNSYGTDVCKVHDDLFYMSRGLIIKNTDTILYLMTREYNYKDPEPLKGNIYIHPEVINNSNHIVNKLILKSLFPTFVKDSAKVYKNRYTYLKNIDINTSIKDMSYIIHNIEKPDIKDLENDVFSKTLTNHLEDIFLI